MLTIEQLRNHLSAMVEAGDGALPVRVWSCEFPEGDSGFYDIDADDIDIADARRGADGRALFIQSAPP